MEWSFICECCDTSTVLVGLITLLVVVYLMKRRRPKGFPPGPRGLPLVGYAPFLGDNPGETLMGMKKKYGTVMSVQMGSEDWVILNDYESINEALVKQGEKFSGRPNNYLFDLLTQGYGLAFADYGKTWKSLRKFGLTTLRGFGVGKKGMEENVIEETSYLLQNLTESQGGFKLKITMAVSNIISRVVFGSRFEYNDEKFLQIVNIIIGFVSDPIDAKVFEAITFAPFLRHLPIFKGYLRDAVKKMGTFMDILQEFVDEHKASYQENDLRDFIDAFMKKIKEKGKNDPSFNERHLHKYILDLFEAGTETTSSTLTWSIFTIAHYPETQEKIAAEVERTIGESGTPSQKHRDEMPYTCAFIHEVMRLKTIVPLSLFHKTNEDAILNDFNIPKNTVVVPNLWAVHHNSEYFADPNEFKPERFLDDDGHFLKSSHVIPFSVGPRHCLGEHLARMEIFIFLTSIVQKLRVVQDPKSPLPPYSAGVSNGTSYECTEFEVNFEKR